MRITPLPNHIFVVARKQKQESKGGIVLQTKETLDTPVGVVVECGDKVESVAFGDKVYIDWAQGKQTTSEGHQGVIIDEKYVLAVIEDDTTN